MFVRLFSVLSLLALPGLASAHVGSGPFHGSVSGGFLHPFLGLDHLLALVAIGVWLAYQKMVTQRVVLPLTLVALVIGVLVGLAGVPLLGVETVIVLSVIAVGLLITLRKQLPFWSAGAIMAGFMLFHGAAHGAEMPAGAGEIGYVLGLVLASGLVLLMSWALANSVRKFHKPVNRMMGVALMLSGGVLATL